MKRLIYLGLALGVSLFIFGCGEPVPELPAYKPKALESQGKGITIAKSTPYNCKILGEVEGKDSTEGTQGAIRETLREGASNDLRNTAGETVAAGKRIMLKITKEEIKCRAKFKDGVRIVDCTNGAPQDAISSKLLSHRMHADVFDCGVKD